MTVSAGYYITKYVARVTEQASLTRQLSMSDMIAPRVPVVYWNDNLIEEARDFGILESDLAALQRWSTERRDKAIAYPDVFYTLDTLNDFASKFLAHTGDIARLGIGLPEQFVDEFIYEARDSGSELAKVVEQRQPLASGGNILGYEVIGFDFGLSTSWLSNGVEQEACRKLRICPNAHGMIDKLEEAVRLTEALRDDEIIGEPIPYYPWLVVEY